MLCSVFLALLSASVGLCDWSDGVPEEDREYLEEVLEQHASGGRGGSGGDGSHVVPALPFVLPRGFWRVPGRSSRPR
ncbi:hypothetical protein [Methanopyrus sp. KOL6]|uniref:hypothetical protein n=1 Tax=Methanopyrus sp. KOL6 TaxID=1937004 RepID=UPI000B4B89F5|nr:hypothetical protein [Methanopyrus sp. KOL6]